MEVKVRQVASEVLSACKRRTRDLLFKELGYVCFMFRYAAHTEEQRRAKISEVLKAKSNLLKTTDGGVLDFARWSCADATKLYSHGTKLSVADRNILQTGDYLPTF